MRDQELTELTILIEFNTFQTTQTKISVMWIRHAPVILKTKRWCLKEGERVVEEYKLLTFNWTGARKILELNPSPNERKFLALLNFINLL